MPDPRPIPGAASPTPPDAPTPPDEYAVLRQIVEHESISGPLGLDELDALESLLRAYEGMRADAERLDWQQQNAIELSNINDDDAQIRIRHRPEFDPLDAAFEVCEWGVQPIDDEGNPEVGKRDYRCNRFGTLREAIDFARAARASAPDSEAENG